MNVKSALIRAAVQLLAANTNLIRKSPYDDFFSTLFNTETEEERIAREAEEAVDKAVAQLKKMRTNHQFKRITKNI